MRTRLSPVLPALVLVTVVLSGCTGDSAAVGVDATAASAEPGAVDLCALAAPSGSAALAVNVTGDAGTPASAAFDAPLTVLGTERTVVAEGTGAVPDADGLVAYAATVFDAVTGARVQEQGYDASPALPVPAASVGEFLGCAPVGSRLAVAVPETDQGGATVWVLDVLDVLPGRATGVVEDPVAGMPHVDVAPDGTPTVTAGGGSAPAVTRVAALRTGDGAVVAPGDSVVVHYTGVRWSDGTVFDSSWDRGAPTALAIADVIPGYREALEGQTVGSQIIAVIPPHAGYGEGRINDADLIGETLIFVVDILATSPAA